MNYILDTWKDAPPSDDLRWLAYALATTFHETAATMLPIAEYGYGAGRPYGVSDFETDQTYYGRGFVQLTWRDNYARADRELDLFADGSLEWHADNALEPPIAPPSCSQACRKDGSAGTHLHLPITSTITRMIPTMRGISSTAISRSCPPGRVG